MRPPLVVLTGATGFVGSSVLRELMTRQERPSRVRVVGRSPVELPEHPGVEWVRGDLTDPASLRGVCEGADALLHTASYTGPDQAVNEAVNHRGSEALAAEARRAGVARIVHLSTAAVYGAGPHRGSAVGEVDPVPVSTVSRSRLLGEAHALAAGAVVLRPGLILGTGDRWVVPALADTLARVPARWDGGRALLSLVDVGDLARLVVALLRAPATGRGVVHHASHPVPVRAGDLLSRLTAHRIVAQPTEDLPLEECLALLRSRPGGVSERQFRLFAEDNWYRSDEVWQAADCPPGPGPLARLGEAADWYRTHLGQLATDVAG
jgi:nucleoside-diphosphate-sugar epimerase